MRLALPEANQVHVWHLDLQHPGLDDLAGELSDDERARAARYRSAELAAHYRHCRGALRQLLGAYLALPAANIVFRYGRYGKPELAGMPLHFNVSHSERFAVISVAAQGVGVDIEKTDRPGLNIGGMIDLVANVDERSAMAQLAVEDRNAAFYRCWTHKEAYCKAVGMGLRQSLVDLHIDGPANNGAARVRHALMPNAPHDHYVYALPAPLAHLASLCIASPNASIVGFQYAHWCA